MMKVGAALFGVEGFHRSLDLVQVVAVDGQHLEAEGLQLFVLGGAVHDFFNGAVDLQMVQVQKDAEIVQLVVGRKHKGLPALALFDLAVAHDGVDPPHLIQPLDLGAQGHAAGGGDALAQAAGGHIHAGDGVHIGVALQAAAQLAQGGQLLRGEKAALGQGCIKGRGRMALGKDQPVPLGPGGVGGVDPHLPEVQKGQHLRDGQAAARVAALALWVLSITPRRMRQACFCRASFSAFVINRPSICTGFVSRQALAGGVSFRYRKRNAGDTLHSNLILSILP